MNDGSGVSEMTLEHYPGMTEKALNAIVGEARSRWDIAVRVIHRVGRLQPRRPHRAGGGQQCASRRSVCRLRVHHGLPENRAPFWKREVTLMARAGSMRGRRTTAQPSAGSRGRGFHLSLYFATTHGTIDSTGGVRRATAHRIQRSVARRGVCKMKEFGILPLRPSFLARPIASAFFLLPRTCWCSPTRPVRALRFRESLLGEPYGTSALEELGSGWLERVHPDDRPTVESGLRRPSTIYSRYIAVPHPGTQRCFPLVRQSRACPAPILTGVAIGYLGLCFDVTAYQDGDFESERTAQHMISLLRHTRLIAVVLDRRGHVEFSNGGLCRLLKYSGVELMDFPLFERLRCTGEPRPGGRTLPRRRTGTAFSDRVRNGTARSRRRAMHGFMACRGDARSCRRRGTRS